MKRKIIAFGLTVGLLIGVLATAIMPLYAGEGMLGRGKSNPWHWSAQFRRMELPELIRML